MNKIKHIFLYGFISFFALVSCDDDPTTNPEPENPSTDIITKSGEITADETWSAENIYKMEGRVTVTGGATLTIEPGTIIKAAPGAGQFASALLISRDGMIMAEGTAEKPIIFTSVADDIQPGEIESPNMDANNNGLWGGIIILGEAPISASADEVQIEGIPTSDANGLYGGQNGSDNSGVFTYVSIRHGGSNIGAGNEINGLTMGGVGSGTTINNIEIVANQDDGLEWFGGNVDVDNVLVWNCGDDALDTDQDWIGTCSNFILVTPRGGSGFELDGPEGSLNRGCHTLNNGIVYAGGDIDHLVDWDDNTNASVTNVYFFGLDSDYGIIEGDFEPIETFGGDGNCPSSGWEATMNGKTVAEVFGSDVASAVSEVPNGQPTVGPSVGDFGWTWAGTSNALTSIGL
ncbi:MAG: hypothetical protein RI842_00480 [Schleiferiaceae bacterium]|nr:hypothetical protein [Schleiferiaceae bacterium]MDR9441168.1 hypothetical protein [Schleiferiaceae bacterium]